MPKVKISRKAIVDAALDVARGQGLEAVTAKRLADRLHCSTQPVYWVFETMDNLRQAVIEAAWGEYLRYLHRAVPDVPPYKAAGLNYVRFAQEQPRLFQMLFMSRREGAPAFGYGAQPQDREIMALVEKATGLPPSLAGKMYLDMWLFMHGIATMVATGAGSFSQEDIGRMGSDVFLALLERFRGLEKEKKP